MIKNIEDLKKCQIVCREKEQVKNCLNYLEQLVLDIDDFSAYYYDGYNIIFWEERDKRFIISNKLKENLKIEFYNKKLIKTLQKFIKEKEEQKKEKKEKAKDFKVASDGRVIKINNKESEKQIFVVYDEAYNYDYEYYKENGMKIVDMAQNYLDFVLKYGLAYTTQEARDKAMFKLEIETKLKNIAERLNKGQKIDWEDIDQDKFRIYYNFKDKILDWDTRYCRKDQGIIYCLGKNFLDVAKQEIGEENLIKYFKE